jgi:hypothetical protein
MRFVRHEVPPILGFCWLAYEVRNDPLSWPQEQSDVITAIQLLSVVPFVFALVWLTREPSASQWLAIRAIHQALAVVVVAVTSISLVGIPDTALAVMWLAIAGALQFVALAVIRRMPAELPAVLRWHRILRISMVFLFAFVFLSLK